MIELVTFQITGRKPLLASENWDAHTAWAGAARGQGLQVADNDETMPDIL